MRACTFLSLLALLASCGPSAVLYTDEVFRAAAPELVDAWSSLRPWRDARITNLPSGAGLGWLRTSLKHSPSPVVLVGVALSAPERSALSVDFPLVRFVFFTPQEGRTAVLVDRREAWATVAKSAASAGAATVLFPAGVTIEERDQLAKVWKDAGGGPLTSWVWPEVGDLATAPATVFQWVGPEADSRVASLPPGTVVHGHPGMASPAASGGLTWAVRTGGLGDFLWNAALDPEEKVHFLPLETVPTNR